MGSCGPSPTSTRTLDELRAALPGGVVVTDPDAVEKYRHDWSRDPSAGTPMAVVRAENAEQVQTAVRWAAAHRVAGGAARGRQRALRRLERRRRRHRAQPGADAAIEIDPPCQVAVVEPGAFNAEVKAAAAEHGLWYPPDPSSFEICSIGGNVATNAGGLCCVKYGVTTDYVLGLDVVLADGTLVTLGGKRIKDVAGLSLLKLFVGSEGTLGHRDPGDPAAGPRAGGPVDPGGDVPDRARGGRGGRRDPDDDAALPARADGPGRRSTRSRTSARWGSTAPPGRC